MQQHSACLFWVGKPLTDWKKENQMSESQDNFAADVDKVSFALFCCAPKLAAAVAHDSIVKSSENISLPNYFFS
jgi:hypothetical protein